MFFLLLLLLLASRVPFASPASLHQVAGCRHLTSEPPKISIFPYTLAHRHNTTHEHIYRFLIHSIQFIFSRFLVSFAFNMWLLRFCSDLTLLCAARSWNGLTSIFFSSLIFPCVCVHEPFSFVVVISSYLCWSLTRHRRNSDAVFATHL